MRRNKKTNVAAANVTLIAAGTEIVGDMKFSGAVQIEGTIKGNLLGSVEEGTSVQVVNGGRVEGDIHAPEVMVNSVILGNVFSAGRVELAPEAKVTGDVHYRVLEMMGGAQINGSLVHAENQQSLPAPELEGEEA